MVTIPSLRAPLRTIPRAPKRRPNYVVSFDPFRLGEGGGVVRYSILGTCNLKYVLRVEVAKEKDRFKRCALSCRKWSGSLRVYLSIRSGRHTPFASSWDSNWGFFFIELQSSA